jgi:hypothetical protein
LEGLHDGSDPQPQPSHAIEILIVALVAPSEQAIFWLLAGSFDTQTGAVWLFAATGNLQMTRAIANGMLLGADYGYPHKLRTHNQD